MTMRASLREQKFAPGHLRVSQDRSGLSPHASLGPDATMAPLLAHPAHLPEALTQLSHPGAGSLRVHLFRDLQRTYGNQMVMRMVGAANGPALQKKSCVGCGGGGNPGMAGECAECTSKRLTLQRRFADQADPTIVPPIVHEVLRSPGQPLDPATKPFMESRFGHDFSQVRVHTDAKAAESAQAVNALAYTVGRDVVFGAGQYTPGTTVGKRLLAHELTHILQQNAENPQASSGPMRIGAPQDRYESEADRAASTALGNRGVAAHLIQHAPSIQRSDGLRLPELSFRLRPPPFRLTDTGERHFRVYFDKGIYIIPRFGESETIERVAEIHLSDPSLHVVLEGHASTEGPTEFNRRLSENRATAVKMLLIARGVAASRIRERGLGESEPAVEETASDPRALEEQRQQNRRVEIFIVSVPTLAPPRLLPTMEELLRIIDDPTRTPEERDLARALRDIGPSEAGRSSTLEDLVERVKRHIELRAGDYVIKPDLETIFKGLKDLLGR